jgi:capsule polysaccharide export protein KpsE/RkpR
VIAFVVIGALAGAILGLVIPGRYSSSARIIPPQQIQSSVATLSNQLGAIGFTGLGGLRNPSDVHVHLLRSDTVARALAQRFQLAHHYGVDTFEDVQRKLESRSKIRMSRDGLVVVRVTDRDPKLAAALANAYVEELHKLVERLGMQESAERRRFMESKVAEVSKSLEEKELGFRAFQEKVGALKVEGQLEQTFFTMGGLRANIMMREVALRALSASATPENPVYRNIEAEIAGLRAQLQKLENNPHVQNPKFVIPANLAPGLALEYIRRLRELKFEEAMYQVMVKQVEFARIEDTKGFPQFLVVDPARPATKRDFPTQPMIVLITTVLGLCVAVFLVATDRIWYPPGVRKKPDQAPLKDRAEP